MLSMLSHPTQDRAGRLRTKPRVNVVYAWLDEHGTLVHDSKALLYLGHTQ